MAKEFSTVPPKALQKPTTFTVSIPETQLSEIRTLLELSKIPSPTYESIQEDGRYGITHKWLTKAKERWLHKFDWSITSLQMRYVC
jgi:microsomal epoxide hydrolase